ncbi:hypothetical protein ES703_04168 [subsurface metagenome]|nr:hypothetical protein [bacterium]
MEFKSEKSIYDGLKTALSAEFPNIKWTPQSFLRALVRMFARGLGLCWEVLSQVYHNIFVVLADAGALARHAVDWGLSWSGNAEQTRAQVLSRMRETNVGSAGWYENCVTGQLWEYVDSCTALVHTRGPNTVDLNCHYHGSRISRDVLDAVEAVFANDDYQIIGVDVMAVSL